MVVIAYSGKVAPAVTLVFKGDSVTGSKSTAATKDYLYVVANESLYEFTIKGEVGGTTYALVRKVAKKKRYFSDALNTYTLPPIKTDILNALLDPAASPKWKIDIKFVYKPFFYHLLKEMTSTDSTLSNVANPKSTSDILDTLKYSRSGDKVKVNYKTKYEYWKDIPLKLVDKEIKPKGSGAPEIKLAFEMDFLTGINDAKRQAMCKLIAMDYTKLLKWGELPWDTLRDFAKVWFKNVFYYLLNHTDFTRGEKIKKKIFDASKSLTNEQISTKMRNDIDQWIITANHWGQRRESWTTEKYQRILSDAFGTMHQTRWFASPVSYLRFLNDDLSLSSADYACLILQYGVGHCGEHATVSYAILSDLAITSGSSVRNVVFTGNANIDHAFAIYGLDVQKVIKTTVKSPRNTRREIGKEIYVWNLRETITDNLGKKGYVMDPYLDPSEIPRAADKLLNALNSEAKKSRKRIRTF